MPPRKVTGERCENRIDPFREPAAVGANTWRCRYCGEKHHPDDYPEVRDQTSSSSGGGVTIEINVDEDGVNVG